MLVDLSSLPVLSQQSSQDSLTPHPLDLGWHSSLRCTLPLTGTSVSTSSLGSQELTSSSSRVSYDGLLDDLTILDELSDVGPGVGIGNVVLLGGVTPNLPLSNAQYRGGETLLASQVDHCAAGWSMAMMRKVMGRTRRSKGKVDPKE